MHVTNPKPVPGQHVHRRRLDRKGKLDAAYEDVDARDAGICWVTGRFTRGPDPRFARDHHHLKGRRVRPAWISKPERIITVTREAHRLITAGFIDVEGCDARKPIFFHWHPSMPKPYPFVIVSKRGQA